MGTAPTDPTPVGGYVITARRHLIFDGSAGKLRGNLVARNEFDRLMWETVSMFRAPEHLCVEARAVVATAWNVPYTGCERKARGRKSHASNLSSVNLCSVVLRLLFSK